MNKPTYTASETPSNGGRANSSKNDDAPRTLHALIDEFETFELKTAILSFNNNGSIELSYRALLRQVRQLASGLLENGLKKGQRVIIAAPNSIDWIISCLSVIYAGGTAVPVDLHLDDESLNHIVFDSDVHWIFTSKEGAVKIRELCPRRHFKMLILDDATDGMSWTKLLSEREELVAAEAEPEDAAILFYTSGTTGMPKGVPLTHSNIIMQLDSVIADLEILGPNDRLLLPLPLFHVYPLNIGLFSCLKRGLPAILPESLTGPELMRAMNEGRATMLIAVPRLLRSLYTGIESKTHANKLTGLLFDALLNSCQAVERLTTLRAGKVIFYPLRKKFSPSLKSLTSGGALLDTDLALKLQALGWDIAVGYGLTETAPLLAIRLPSNHDLESVGKPIPGVEIRISPKEDDTEGLEDDDSSKSKNDQNEGEIEARGKNIFHSYLNLEDKTKEAFTDDGWFKTGDLGYFKNGNLHITGRASSLLVMEGGKKIQPENLEDKYAKSPGIKEIAILQVEHKLVALVFPNRGSGDQAKEIGSALNSASSSLPSHLKITDFAIVHEPLPRTNLGKLKRHELNALYDEAKSAKKGKSKAKTTPQSIEEMSSEDRNLLADETALHVWEWLSKRFPDSGLSLDSSPQLDLNVDSFEWMNLTLDIMQNTGIELREDAITRIETIRDLLNEAVAASKNQSNRLGSPVENPDKFIDDKLKHWLTPLSPFEKGLSKILYSFNHWLMRCLFKVTALGLEDVPAGQIVIIPNHASYLDILILGAAIPYERLSKTQIAGWAGIAFANPFNSFMSRLVRAFPIEAKRSLVSSLALGAAVLKNGDSMIWFPEGQRTLDGKLLKFKPGIGMLLESSSVDVVPVYLDGTREALPPGAFFPKLCEIYVVFGKAINSNDLTEKAKENSESGNGAIAESIANQLRTKVQSLSKRALKLRAIDKSE
ncbi:MAG: AMP-binding protein [Candidatus Obscuribacterales bacterium]|nr:AMP-binding protein [Candidatus Obscuribacterales bacterium]